MFSPPLAWHVDRRHWKMKTIVRCHRVKRTLKCNLHTPLWFLFDFAVCELHDRECPMLSSFVFEKQCAEHEWTSIHYSCHLFDASQLVDTSLANVQIRTLSRACVFRKSLVNLMTVALLLRTSLRVHCRAACVMSWTSQRKHEKAMQISRPSVEFFQFWDRWQPSLTSKSCNVGARWREALYCSQHLSANHCHFMPRGQSVECAWNYSF